MLPALLMSAHHETLDEIERRAVPRERGKAFPLFTKPEDAEAWQFVKTKRKDRACTRWMVVCGCRTMASTRGDCLQV